MTMLLASSFSLPCLALSTAGNVEPMPRATARTGSVAVVAREELPQGENFDAVLPLSSPVR
eukprot:962718-Pyramimonas_sp.AAC.1